MVIPQPFRWSYRTRDLLDHKVLLEQLALQDQRAHKDRLDRMAVMGLRGRSAQWAFKELQVLLDPQVQRELLVQQVLRESQDYQVPSDPQELQDLRDLLVQLAQ